MFWHSKDSNFNTWYYIQVKSLIQCFKYKCPVVFQLLAGPKQMNKVSFITFASITSVINIWMYFIFIHLYKHKKDDVILDLD